MTHFLKGDNGRAFGGHVLRYMNPMRILGSQWTEYGLSTRQYDIQPMILFRKLLRYRHRRQRMIQPIPKCSRHNKLLIAQLHPIDQCFLIVVDVLVLLFYQWDGMGLEELACLCSDAVEVTNYGGDLLD